MPNPLQAYLLAVRAEYASGEATEHSYRPALKVLLEATSGGLHATNEPKHVACGAPDFVLTRPTGHGALTVGYVEAKDVGKLTRDIERTPQIRRYLTALPNFLLTDYLEFRWFADGERRAVARLAYPWGADTLLPETGGADAVFGLLQQFVKHKAEPISRPEELARRMARLTHMIRDLIMGAFDAGEASSLLKGWRTAFAQVLIADLDQPVIEKTIEFADMFAQTLAYGLFSARVMYPGDGFTRAGAQALIPRTNPFLRDFFEAISGNKLNDEPFAPFVDDLVRLLADTDIEAVLAHFGKRTRQQDPVVHFYETFLADYDPQLRERRGVYYTPEPVVSYIVRSVDYLLRKRFDCADGLADRSKVSVPVAGPPVGKGGKSKTATRELPRVLVLDPACGTGTFLYAVIDQIRERFMAEGNAGLWSGFVRDELLPRLFGFELLMAPYAVAHFKLGLQLAGRDLPEAQRAAWAYDFKASERLGVYLTNALEGPHEYHGLPLFTQFLADETDDANAVKRDLPIMVVMGNPPYSGHSANKGEWMQNLLRGKELESGAPTANYFAVDGAPLGERNPKWLNDDYVKFIRFAQWRIERTGGGVLAFISNNGYLDNPTFRGMRQALMQTFTDIFILDLHGNSKKQERSPDGSADENVFDIQQGVAIGLFIKAPGKRGPARLHHADLWGIRESKDKQSGKYPWLLTNDVESTDWAALSPQSPSYLFVPRDTSLQAEYDQGWRLPQVFPLTRLGPNSHRDDFAIAFDRQTAVSRIADFFNVNLSNEEVRAKYALSDNSDWSLEKERSVKLDKPEPIQCLYRPFDIRFMLYGQYAFDRLRPEMNDNLLHPNLALISTRQTKEEFAILVTNRPVGQHKLVTPYDGSYLSPLYIYPTGNRHSNFDHLGRHPNLDPAFVTALTERIELAFVPDGKGDLTTTFGPDDVFAYVYAVLQAPSYRDRYAPFLKSDFPRIPLTRDGALFRALCALGARLVAIHLLERTEGSLPSYPVKGPDKIDAIRYTPPTAAERAGRVWINGTQFFAGVSPATWEMHIGGYQPAEKWLKDRKGRVLTSADLEHYRRLIAALAATPVIQAEIDATIPGWPLP